MTTEDTTTIYSKLTIVIPAHNEVKRIGPTIERYLKHFSDEVSFIIEMDGCTDNTLQLVSGYCENYTNLNYVAYDERLGKGGGLKRALGLVNSEYIAFTDADGSIAPKELEKVIRGVTSADCTIGSRYHNQSQIRGSFSFKRRLASRAYTFIVKRLLGLDIRDSQCGAKAFHTTMLKKVFPDVKDDGFGFDAELLYRIYLSGYEIKEVPICWEHKGGSKLTLWRTAPKMLMSLVSLRLGTK